MELTIEIRRPLDARAAWLAAVLQTPIWDGPMGGERTPPPLWARLLITTFQNGWIDKDQEEQQVSRWDGCFYSAVALAQYAGAPSYPAIESIPDDGLLHQRWTHQTRHEHGSTLVVLDFPATLSDEPYRLTVRGHRQEAVLRRMHAAAEALEGMARDRGELPARPVSVDNQEEVQIVKRYEAVDEDEGLLEAYRPQDRS